jgi:endonuclease/exonuclease/phosphatase family metal-dependent hydrolase
MGIALREPATVRRLGIPFRDAHVATIARLGPWGTPLELEVLNVHFIAPHTERGRALGQRRAQLASLLRYLTSESRRRVLVGDLNATPLWPVYRRLAAHLNDAAVLAAASRPRSAHMGPWPGAPRLLRIDHALVHGVAVADFHVCRRDPRIVVDLLPVATPSLARPGRNCVPVRLRSAFIHS